MCCFPLVGTAEIYKHIDAEGHITYTDRPAPETAPREWQEVIPNSKKTEEPASNSASSNNTANTAPDLQSTHGVPSSQESKAAPQNAPIPYSIQIVSPKGGNTLTPESQSISVEVSLSPTLAADDVVALIVDGQLFAQQTSLTFVLPPFPRGEHILQAKVLSREGKVLAESSSVTLYQQRPSALLRPR